MIAGVRARSLRPKPLAPPPRLPHYLHASDVKKILDDMRDFQRAKLKALMDEVCVSCPAAVRDGEDLGVRLQFCEQNM